MVMVVVVMVFILLLLLPAQLICAERALSDWVAWAAWAVVVESRPRLVVMVDLKCHNGSS
jgi:hypothetical protein